MIELRGNPLSHGLRRASSPEGGAFGHLPVSADKAPPSGELANAVSLRGFVPRSAALSQKAALQLPLAVTTPPVKMGLERSAELVRAKPFHLLAQTALPLKSPTGAFIAAQTRSLQTRNYK